jgi:hypothetical protein
MPRAGAAALMHVKRLADASDTLRAQPSDQEIRMKILELALVAMMAMTLAHGASAQPGPGGPCAAASGASAPGPGCGPGMGPRARWGSDYTPGWSMMTQAERQSHRDTLMGFKTYDECKAYMDKHHDEMVSRAQSQGRTAPVRPRHDPCAPLKAAK